MRMPSNSQLNCSLTSLDWCMGLGSRNSGLSAPLANGKPQTSVSHKERFLFMAQKGRIAAEKKKNGFTKSASAPKVVAASASSGGSHGLAKKQKDKSVGINWNANSTEKPPHCYATLIYMAIRQLRKDKVTLGEIYTFVKSNFMYYRTHDNGWKNSIRHNLTQHKCFSKVQRNDEHPGKGGYWQLSRDYEVMFQNGIFKRKRRKVMSPSNGHPTLKLTIRGLGAGKLGKRPGSPKQAANHALPPSLPHHAGGMEMPFQWANMFDGPSDGDDDSDVLSVAGITDDDVEALEGIDWENFNPADGPIMQDSAGSTGGDSSSSSSMLSALTLMDGTAGAPQISILPDINQNNGSGMPESYTFAEVHDEMNYKISPQEIKPTSLLSINAQLMKVESSFDLSGNISAMGEMSGGMVWNGDDLTVRGVGLNISDHNIVPVANVKKEPGECDLSGSEISRDYIHITPDDLHDLDLSSNMSASQWIM